MTDKPVMVITDAMLDAGSMVIAMLSGEPDITSDELCIAVFTAMLTEREGGNIAFTDEDEEELFAVGNMCARH